MCGIFGILNLDNKDINPKHLKEMSESMIFRGPDDSGELILKNFGFGMRRLSIVDPNGECQPISSIDNNIHIIFNGEIYNYIELRDELIKKNYTFKTNGDVEVLIHLYKDRGIKGLEEVNGMFAFALFDQEKNLLWVARDRVGIKPLFYYKDDNKFIFASDLNSINKILKKEVNLQSVIAYLGYSYIPDPKTKSNVSALNLVSSQLSTE